MQMTKIIGKNIIRYKEIDSTNDEARRLLAKGAGEGTVIIAGSQSGGRGKPGRGWFSPPGVGVYLSAIVKPYKNPQDLAPLTLLGARAVINTIKKLSALLAVIKPPNDVLINGRKVCGVLAERTASGHLMIGVGVNINNAPHAFPEELRSCATSLLIESGKACDLAQFTATLIAEMDKEYLAYLENI